MSSTDHFSVNEPNVIQEIIDGEAIIADLSQGFYYSLDQNGSLIWRALVNGWSVSDIIDATVDRFPSERSEIEVGINDLVGRLQSEQLIVSAPAETEPAGTISKLLNYSGSTAFVAPELSKYTDMEQLLLLDPIHDVDETGWPNVAEETG